MNPPPSTPSPTTANTGVPTSNTTANTKPECSNCGLKDRWILHNIQLRGVDRRLCTSCVLRIHPAAFCPFCFEFFEQNPLVSTFSLSSLGNGFLKCNRCSSLGHIHCLPFPRSQPSSFLCPPCSGANFSFFDVDNLPTGGNNSERVLDKKSARVLLCAAKIASASLNKAANLAKMEADKRVKEAALARAEAKDELLRLAIAVKCKPVEGFREVSGPGNLGNMTRAMWEKEVLGSFGGPSKLSSLSLQNGLSGSGTMQHVEKNNEVPGFSVGGGSFIGVNETANGKGKSVINEETHEGDLERLRSSHGRSIGSSFR